MNKIEITKLIISHFKGIKSLVADFGRTTNIRGDNATGKTTIMDAFLWLLFGKDSTDRKEFEVKHISHNGNGGPKDVDVEGILLVNNRQVKLKRVFMEKWIKKRGALEAEFSGHETRVFYNDVPMNLRDYQEKIAAICSEDIFKMITNPYYFNSLRWDVQRNILFEMVGGDITDDSVANRQPEFESLMEELTGKSLDEYKKQIAAQKRKIKSELELIPARIDEVNRSIPEPLNWEELSAELQQGKMKLQDLDSSIADRSKAYEAQYKKKVELQGQMHEIRNKLQNLIAGHKQQAYKQYQATLDANSHIRSEIDSLQLDIRRKQSRLSSINAEIQSNELERDKLRAVWHSENKKEFSFEQTACPTCNRPYDDIEERKTDMQSNFNKDKSEKLRRIVNQGKVLKQLTEEFQGESEKIHSDIEHSKQKLESLQSRIQPATEPQISFDDIEGYLKEKNLLQQLEAEYSQPVEQPDIKSLKRKKDELQTYLQDVNDKLATREQIIRGNQRIHLLENQQQQLAQDLADLEKIEFVIQNFEREKSDAIEQKVNSMFRLVKWRLFEKQINGQEIPTCKAMYKEVPWPDLNSAAKANVGLDIINTLSRHYAITAPVFLDNREGINHLIDTPSQLINLSVSKDPQLVIEI